MNVLATLLFIILVIHLAYYLLIFSRLIFYRETALDDKADNPPSTIVVCYHNEETNIDKTLPSVLDQNAAEWVLLDDNSSDDTRTKLSHYVANPKIKLAYIDVTTPGKKQALALGIRMASNQNILLTDADCTPASAHWATHMNKHTSDFVLGYGPLYRRRGLAPLLSRYETYMTALQYLSYALVGMPYMGVGRNMKLDKRLIQSNEEKVKGKHLASGDDDLRVNALATANNTRICLHPQSFVYSEPKTSVVGFLRQKARHISTSIYYKPIHQLLLGIFSASQILFFSILFAALALQGVTIIFAVKLLIFKWIVQLLVNAPIMKKLKEEDLIWKIPFLDLLFFVYLLSLPIYYLFNKNTARWS